MYACVCVCWVPNDPQISEDEITELFFCAVAATEKGRTIKRINEEKAAHFPDAKENG